MQTTLESVAGKVVGIEEKLDAVIRVGHDEIYDEGTSLHLGKGSEVRRSEFFLGGVYNYIFLYVKRSN